MNPRLIALSGRLVRLEPLTADHAPDLFDALRLDPSVWQWWRVPPPETLGGMAAIVREEVDLTAAGSVVAFAQVEVVTGRARGATRYMDIRRSDLGLEIGGTWLGRPWQRSGMNTEAKYLLLRHAFEDLGAARVQLKTDGRNTRSQAAIERLGAVREGVLRRHMVVRDGFVRDTVMYSVLADEWPAVKARLEGFLARPGATTSPR